MAAPEEGGQLAGTGVLVTRPRAQAARLVTLIESAGGRALPFPTIEIVPPADDGTLRNALAHLGDAAFAIFVSTNAVVVATGALTRAGKRWPAAVPAAAVGEATAQALREAGVTDVRIPEHRFDSEGLLALPLFHAVTGQTVILFRGEGGRTLLADTLRARGATVIEAICYRRIVPTTDTAPLRAWLHAGSVDVVTATSIESLHNLHAMVAPPARAQLLALPLVVTSARVAAAATALGFVQTPVISEQPSDEAILKAIHACGREAKAR